MKYQLTHSPDAIASDDSGDLVPYLFPDPDACQQCVRQVKHLHNMKEETTNA